MVHSHTHTPANYGRAFAIGVALNLAFVVIEAVYGKLSHSLALVADAGHNLSDVLGLVLAWGAMLLARSIIFLMMIMFSLSLSRPQARVLTQVSRPRPQP